MSLYVDPGYRWVSRLQGQPLNRFTISDKTIVVAILTIATEEGAVVCRRLFTIDDTETHTIDLKRAETGVVNSRHLLQLTGAETAANTAGNSALQVTNDGANSDLNLCYLNGLKNDLCQHVQLEAVRQSGVSFDFFAGDTNKLMSAMGTKRQLGPRVRSLSFRSFRF